MKFGKLSIQINVKLNITSDSNQELMGDDPFDVPLIFAIEIIS